MAYDDYQADRIARILREKNVSYTTKKMFSGMVFMIDEKMCIGTHIDKKSGDSLLMVRLGEESFEANKDRAGCQPMDFTGRPMKDYAFITPEGYDTEDDLAHWVNLAVAFNPFAKASKKRKSKKS